MPDLIADHALTLGEAPTGHDLTSSLRGASGEFAVSSTDEAQDHVTVARLEGGVVHVRYRGRLSDEALRRHHEALEALMTEKTRVAVILDMSLSMGLSPSQARIQAGWVKRQREHLSFCAGLAFVLPNVAQRAVIKSILRVAPLGCPYTVAPDLAEAQMFCRGQLERYV